MTTPARNDAATWVVALYEDQWLTWVDQLARPWPHIREVGGGTCDWGGCDRQAVAARWASELREWLPVCAKHGKTREAAE